MSSVPIRPWTNVRLSNANERRPRGCASQTVSPAARTMRNRAPRATMPDDHARAAARPRPLSPKTAIEQRDEQLAERRVLHVRVEPERRAGVVRAGGDRPCRG